MTHLPAPALNTAPEKLSVALTICLRLLRDTDPLPRVAFRPPPRMATPLDMYQPIPLRTINKGVLTGIDSLRVLLQQRSPNFPTAQTMAPLVPKATPPRRYTCIAALEIHPQDIRKAETAAPPNVEANEESTPSNNIRSKTAIHQSTRESMLASFDIFQHTANARTLARHQYPKEFLSPILNKDTGELMEYRHLIGNPKYLALWSK